VTPLSSAKIQHPPHYLERPIHGRNAYTILVQTVFLEPPQGFIVDFLERQVADERIDKSDMPGQVFG
jgi:hypothetical protein